MKVLVTALAVALSSIWLAPADAEARSRSYGKKKQAQKYQRRPASVGPNGLCQRDTGTPTSELNFRNRCDTEEFWRRQERGGFGRR